MYKETAAEVRIDLFSAIGAIVIPKQKIMMTAEIMI